MESATVLVRRAVVKKCPECGYEVKQDGVKVEIDGKSVEVCCQECAEAIQRKAKKRSK